MDKLADKYIVDGKEYEVEEKYLQTGKTYHVDGGKYDGCTGVSDKIFGYCLNDACDVHDAVTRNDVDFSRKQGDQVFFSLMVDAVTKQASNPLQQCLGYLVALWRYLVVRYITGWIFWKENGNPSLWDKIKGKYHWLVSWLK